MSKVSFYNFKCFGTHGSGFFSLSDINVVIGRNNSGKSAVADAFKWVSKKKKFFDQSRHGRPNAEAYVELEYALEESDLRRVFPENTSGGPIRGSHWLYGRQFIGQKIIVRFDSNITGTGISGLEFPNVNPEAGEQFRRQLASAIPLPYTKSLIEVAAERDVQPEPASNVIDLAPNGVGLTNMVRAFINKDSLPRYEVEVELLRELNIVFEGDAIFRRISCREGENGNWEIFLNEDGKGDIRLSQSGSSLKSVFIILSKIRLSTIVSNVNMRDHILLVEEPENNLHPALLRRLLEFLADKSISLGFHLLVATHSPIAIDWISRRGGGKILHVTNNGSNATVKEASEYVQLKNVLEDLDIRASDILQSNGIIWVEGPSDRIYVKKWLDILSNGVLREGVHYSIMFYGGKLLSHLSAEPPSKQSELVGTLSLNRNAAIVVDSDRHMDGGVTANGRKRRPRLNINSTKKRIVSELEKVNGFIWITHGREIENYIPARILKVISGNERIAVDEYVKIPESKFMVALKHDKMQIAAAATSHWTIGDFETALDLGSQIKELMHAVLRWNSMSPDDPRLAVPNEGAL